MANHAALIYEQHAPGRPVRARGRNWIEFDMGSGVYKRVLAIDPLHVRNSETPIDTAFVVDTGAWQWKLAAADFQVHARDVFNAGSLVEWRHASGEWIIVDPQSLNWINGDLSRQQIAIKQAVAGIANDATLTYPAGYGPGIDFEYIAHPKRLVKHFIIDQASRLPTPTVTGTIHLEAEWTLSTSTGVDLWLDGARWSRVNGVRVRSANRIEFRNIATGEVLWYADAPTATDAAGETVACEYEVRRQGGPGALFITVRVPKTWLDAATFPIVIDPTFTDGYGGDVQTYNDAMAIEFAPNNNYVTSDNFYLKNYATETGIGLVKFDLSSLSGATVTSSTLYLYNLTSTQSAKDFAVNAILSANSAWTEDGAKWNYATGTTRWAGDTGADGGSDAGCSVSGTDYNSSNMGTWATGNQDAVGTEYVVTLNTTMTEAWITANYGAVLRMVTESGSANTIATSDHATTGYRPKLVVVYTEGGGPVEETASAGRTELAAIAGQLVAGAPVSAARTQGASAAAQAVLQESISLARQLGAGALELPALAESISLPRSLGATAEGDITGAPIEESIALSITLRCAEPWIAATEESAGIAITQAVSISAQVVFAETVSLARTHDSTPAAQISAEAALVIGRTLTQAPGGQGTLQDAVSAARALAAVLLKQLTVGDAASLARTLSAAAGHDASLQDAIALARSLGLTAAETGVLTEAFVLARQLSTAQVETGVLYDSLTLARVLALTVAVDIPGVEETVELARSLGLSALDAPILSDTLALVRQLGAAVSETGVLGDAVSLARSLAATAIGDLAGTDEGVTLGRELGITIAETTTLADSVSLSRLPGVSLATTGILGDSLSAGRTLGITPAASLPGLEESITLSAEYGITAQYDIAGYGESVTLGRAHGLSVDTQASLVGLAALARSLAVQATTQANVNSTLALAVLFVLAVDMGRVLGDVTVSDATLYSAALSDASVYSIALSDAALFALALSDYVDEA